MEILVHLFGHVLGIIIEILFQILSELTSRWLATIFKIKEPLPPIWAGIAYFLLGALVGGASLIFLPKLLIDLQWLRIINLMITPAICGLIMTKFGDYQKNRGRNTVRLDTFWYAYIFAFAMALVRFIWHQ